MPGTLHRYLEAAEPRHRYPGADLVQDLARRIAAFCDRVESGTPVHDADLLTATDVAMLGVLARYLLDTSTSTTHTAVDVGRRMALGAEMLEVQDAVRGVLVDQEKLPPRGP